MASKTATQIKTTLEAKTYPYKIRFYTFEPKYPVYPYISVVKTQPQSTTQENITDITKSEAFEIKLHIRYTRLQATEEADQTTIENTILSAIETQDFGTSFLFMEQKRWQRNTTDRPIYGSESAITVTLTDKASTSGSGILGAETSFAISGGSTIKILGLEQQEGAGTVSHHIDSGEVFRDITTFDRGVITITYESTNALDSEIQTIREAGDDKNITLTKKGTAKNFIVKFGNTSKRGQFDNIERATTTLYVQGVWT
jgi:hypothetical protein